MTTPPRVLVVVAHPDDETFGCGSLLRYASAAGAYTGVVCATRGEAGELAAGVEALEGLAALRENELRSAATVLGVDEIHVLDFADSGMEGEPTEDTLAGAPFGRVAEAVGRAVSAFHPDVLVSIDGGDGHRDHRRIRTVVEHLADGTETPTYLHCLPRSLMHRWVLAHSDEPEAVAYTDLPEIGTPDEEITTVLDTERFLADRDAAIAEHRSQRSPFAGLPEDLRRAFLTREHLVRVNPPWTGGPVENELLGLAGSYAAGL